MKPELAARILLATTRAKAKMYEYHVPEEDHIIIERPLTELIDLAIGILGDLAADYESLTSSVKTERLLFSAKYFDALLNSQTADSFSEYLKFLAACCYMLSDYPGSASVLVRSLGDIGNIGFNADALDEIVFCLLKGKALDLHTASIKYDHLIKNFLEKLEGFNAQGIEADGLRQAAALLKKTARQIGSDRELLFGDIVYALTLRHISTSSWNALPLFTDLRVSLWKPYLLRNTSIKSLWPSQMLLGDKGIFKGASSVVQMPTSAGKTKATEIIIRCSFLSGRSKLSVIVAPFRALCQEIYDNILFQFKEDKDVFVNLASEVSQTDLEFEDQIPYQILILTPEKLEFLLRHNPELAYLVGLIIYDEGHLFDDPTRGAKYELLLASLKRSLGESTQVILISAVITNALDIGKWLIGETFVPVEARRLNPTNRNIAFASWKHQRGRLEFVDEADIDKDEFFVPRVMEQQELRLKKGESARRFFPEKKSDVYSSNHIALYLGCRLSENGAVAIFTGRKDSAAGMARNIVDAFDRGFDSLKPLDNSNVSEMQRLTKYITVLLGENSPQAKAACLGVFVHHGDTPHGLRLSIEHALQKGHAKFVICTSTLAQGVNLPIRYLIITTDRQGADRIKTRDFHNLMGRAGRSGVYTEGTVIFADHKLFDNKLRPAERWRWEIMKRLLNPDNAAECKSRLLSLFSQEPDDLELIPAWRQNKLNIEFDISTYLLNAMSEIEDSETLKEFAQQLAKKTLAYSQANEDEKDKLTNVFMTMAQDILSREPDKKRRAFLSKSIVPLEASYEILIFMQQKAEILAATNEPSRLLEILWPIVFKFKKNNTTIAEQKFLELFKLWISGAGYPTMLEAIMGERIGNRRPSIDHIVHLCENGFAFNDSLIIGSCHSLLELVNSEKPISKNVFLDLQKMAKYGLPNKLSITLWELGLTDRKLAMELGALIEGDITMCRRKIVVNALKGKSTAAKQHIQSNYPMYFSDKFESIVR